MSKKQRRVLRRIERLIGHGHVSALFVEAYLLEWAGAHRKMCQWKERKHELFNHIIRWEAQT
jgi:hypothetical protein